MALADSIGTWLPFVFIVIGIILILIVDLVQREDARGLVVFITTLTLINTALMVLTQDIEINSEMFHFGSFFKIFSAIGLLASVIVAIAAWRDLSNELDIGVFMTLLLLANLGGMLLAASTHLIPLYIGYELVSIPTYGMVAFRKRSKISAEASMKIFLLGALSSAIMMYGLAMYYGATGTFSMGATALEGSEGFQVLAVVLIAAGSGFKIGLIPFHLWIPDVYSGASLSAVTFLSAASKKYAFAFVFQLFFVGMPFWANNWGMLFAVLATLSMIIGNIVAVVQDKMMRIIAYSTIAQAGYITIGIATYGVALEDGNPALATTAMEGIIFHIIAHVLMKGAAIVAILMVVQSYGSDDIENFRGLYRKDPIVGGSLAVALFSLMGIPPTAGFFGKLFLFLGAVEADLLWLAMVGVLGSAISIFYYARVIRIMADEPSDDTPLKSSTELKFILVVLTIFTLVFAYFGDHVTGFAADIIAENFIPS